MVNGNNLSTVRDFVRHATTEFAEHEVNLGQGTETHFDEACFLILRTLSLPLHSLDVFLDAALTPPEVQKVLHNIEQRAKEKVPAAYILNEAWLREYKFHVNKDVLIPRSHIADLLFDQMDVWIASPESVEEVLDLCTGSGCLAILAAHQFQNSRVVASDLSQSALSVCETNIEKYQLKGQITPIQSDLFSAINQRFDLIISNPPYVDQESMDELPPEFQMEPKMALAGGDDGIDLVQRIIKEAPDYLATNGILIVEVGRDRAAIESEFPKMPFTWIETQSGRDFVFLLSREDLCSGLTG